MKRVVIIGGGISGLAAAHRLLERTRDSGKQTDLKLLEGGNRVGGIVQTQRRDGFLLENGPDSFISEKPAARELAKRLGLESRLIETNEQHRRSFIVSRGRLLPVPEGFHLLAPARFWPFLKSDIFSWPGKARMALDLLLPRRDLNGSKPGNADESLAEFVRRRLGQEALERMAQPMVGGIYTADPEQLSLRATMPRFLEMEREHRSLICALRKQARSPVVRKGFANRGSSPTVREGSINRGSSPTVREGSMNRGSSPTVREGSEIEPETSGARYSLFLSFDRGMQVLTDKLSQRIMDLGSQISNFQAQISASDGFGQTSIRLNTTVESVTLEQGEHGEPELPNGGGSPKWRLKTSTNETFIADAVCLALPAYVSARLLRNLDAQLASELEGIPYASSATINLAYERADIPHPLDGFGFVVPFIEKRTLLACTFSSVKFAGRAPRGQVLLRAFVGGALQPELFDLSQAELLLRVRADLRDLLGIEAAPLFAEVSKWERSMPQYHVGHLERVQRIEARVAALPGLVLAGNAYSGLGLPDCIRSGEAAADLIDAF
jgi:oxygen-dependent protoporphyrinogen oxidase